jgi:hypothetical protein
LAFSRRKGAPPGSGSILNVEVRCESSALNGPEAKRSRDGGCTGVPSSELISWEVRAAKKNTSSSGAAELIAATFESKYTQGTRILVRELALSGVSPWPFNLDATSALSDVEMERVSNPMRYVTARFSLV